MFIVNSKLKKSLIGLFLLTFFVIIFLSSHKVVNFLSFYHFSTKPIVSNTTTSQLPLIPGQTIHWTKTVPLQAVSQTSHLLTVPSSATAIKISVNSDTVKSEKVTELKRSDLVKLSEQNRQSLASQSLSEKIKKERATGFWASLSRTFSRVNSLFATVSEEVLDDSNQEETEVTLVDLAPIVEEVTGEEITPEEDVIVEEEVIEEETIEETTTTTEEEIIATSTEEIIPAEADSTGSPQATTTEEIVDDTPVESSGGGGGGGSDPEPADVEDDSGEATEVIATTTDSIATSTASSTDLVVVEYETPAPVIAEAETDTGKIVSVSSDGEQEIITNVLAFTTIPEIFKVGQEDKIKIKWTNNGDQNVTFHAYDTDNNGKLDYVEWTVPHLSEQIFEIIFISKAFELDENQDIVNDIYESVFEKDNVWVTVSDTHSVRVTFEKILDNTKDITVYAKPAGFEDGTSEPISNLGSKQILAEKVKRNQTTSFWSSINQAFSKVDSLFATVGEIVIDESDQNIEEDPIIPGPVLSEDTLVNLESEGEVVEEVIEEIVVEEIISTTTEEIVATTTESTDIEDSSSETVEEVEVTPVVEESESPEQVTIEVYPVYTDELGNVTRGPKLEIVNDGENPDFSNIDRDGKYRILLENLQTPTDMFDLKIIGGDIDFDYIVDPPNWAEELNKIQASDKQADDYFGRSVSISGNYAIVGAYAEDTGGTGAGSAYIFQLSEGVWTETQKIQASDREADDRFGWSVFISGDYVIVGAVGEDTGGSYAGAAYIFQLNGGVWTEIQKIQASDKEASDYFGNSVSLSGNYVIVGAPYEDTGGSNTGSAYIFQLSEGVWTEIQKIQALDKQAEDYFSYSVFISGDYVLVGAYAEDTGGTGAGSAYIFQLSEGVWTGTQKIQASDKEAGDSFGWSVFISGNYAIVGAFAESPGGTNQAGSAYIFQLNEGVWTETQKIQASDKEAGDSFGWSVFISGNYAIVGAYHEYPGGTNQAGSAYIFQLNEGVWTETQKIQASDKEAGDLFGDSVSISGNYAIVGAYAEDTGGSNAGSAYIFELEYRMNLDITLPANNAVISDYPFDLTYSSLLTPTECYYNLNGRDSEIFSDDAPISVIPNLADNGEQTLALYCTEGNTNEFDSVTVDLKTVDITSIYDDAFLTRDSVTLNYNTTADAVSCRYSTDGGTTFSAPQDPEEGWTFNNVDFEDGQQTWSVYCVDAEANEVSDSVTFLFEIAPNWVEELNKIQASDKEASDYFGNSVSLSGDYAIVGAYVEDTGGTDAGSAYIFHQDGGVWTEIQKIQASDKEVGDNFGYSVSISGDYAIVGARAEDTGGTNAGAAYIFQLSEGVWTEIQKIQALDKQANDQFGSSVSISSNYAIIGSQQEDPGGTINAGSAYIFQLSEGVWTEMQKIQASDKEADDQFGWSVSISGDYVIVGAVGEDTGGSYAGAAYIFQLSEGVWTEMQKIQASDKEASDYFGNSVSLSGDYAIVGAYLEDTGGSDVGAAYIFQQAGGVWTEIQKIQALDKQAEDYFSFSVSISGDYVIVGAVGEDTGGSIVGAAYIFQLSEGVWTEMQKIQASDKTSSAWFGNSVSLSGDYAIVGAYVEDTGGSNAGAAYIFDLEYVMNLDITSPVNNAVIYDYPFNLNYSSLVTPTECYYNLNSRDSEIFSDDAPISVTPNLADNGEQTLTLYCTEGTINESDSITINLEKIVDITSPVDNTVSVDDFITLDYTVADDAVSCRYSTDGGITFSDSQSPEVGWTLNHLNLTEGEQTWTVYCVDAESNEVSDRVTFTLNPQTTVTLTTPTASEIEVENDSWFEVTAEVACTVGNCGAVDVTLDPMTPGCNIYSDPPDVSDCNNVFINDSSTWSADSPSCQDSGGNVYISSDATCDEAFGDVGNGSCAQAYDTDWTDYYTCPSYERNGGIVSEGDCVCSDGGNGCANYSEVFNFADAYFTTGNSCGLASCNEDCSGIFQSEYTDWSAYGYAEGSEGNKYINSSGACSSAPGADYDCAFAYFDTGDGQDAYYCPSYDRFGGRVTSGDCYCEDWGGGCDSSAGDYFNFSYSYFTTSIFDPTTKSGIIPTGSGVPFYTNAISNPKRINLGTGIQEVTFWVKANAEVMGSYENFFIYTTTVDVESVDDASNMFDVVVIADTTTPVQSNWSPATTTVLTTKTPTITFDLNESGDCRASLLDDSYDLMSDDVNCTGDGTTSISCAMSDLGTNGSKDIYLACQDSLNNQDTAETNTKLTYTLQVSSGGGSSPQTCTYTYSDWSTCVNSQQTRTIVSQDSTNCSNASDALSQACTLVAATTTATTTPPVLCTNYTYSDWGSCINSLKTRTALTSIPTVCLGGAEPTTTEACDSEVATTTASTTLPIIPTCLSYTYSTWGDCLNGNQSRTTLTSIPDGCVGGVEAINTQSCVDTTIVIKSIISPTTLKAGDAIDVNSDGWKANSEVTITIYSDPILLGTLEADSDGVITGSFNIPDDLSAGDHQIQLQGIGLDGEPRNLFFNLKITKDKFVKNVKDSFSHAIASSSLNISQLVVNNIGILGTTTERVVLEVKKIAESPVGSTITNTITTAGVVGGGIAATGALAMSGVVMADLAFLPFKLWALLLSVLGLKKRNRPWGTVYDSVTKQPIDPAYVTLKNLETNEETTSITDLDGRYGFLVPPGTYTLSAHKTNYDFPSKKSVGKIEDVLYTNLYLGGEIIIPVTGAVISKNIPLDPIKFDWNEFVKGQKKLMKFYSKREKLVRIITDWFFRIGFIVSLISLFLVAAPYNYVIFGLYIILVLLRKFGLKQKALGSLTDKEGNPLSFAIVRVYDAELKVQITNKVANQIGKYYCLVNNGKYYVTIEKKNEDESYTVALTSDVFEATNGIINRDFTLVD